MSSSTGSHSTGSIPYSACIANARAFGAAATDARAFGAAAGAGAGTGTGTDTAAEGPEKGATRTAAPGGGGRTGLGGLLPAAC